MIEKMGGEESQKVVELAPSATLIHDYAETTTLLPPWLLATFSAGDKDRAKAQPLMFLGNGVPTTNLDY